MVTRYCRKIPVLNLLTFVAKYRFNIPLPYYVVFIMQSVFETEIVLAEILFKP